MAQTGEKSYADIFSPVKGRHERRVSPDHHPATVRKINKNGIKWLKHLGNDPLTCKDKHKQQVSLELCATTVCKDLEHKSATSTSPS